MYSVFDKTKNKYTGTQYSELTQKIQDYHYNQNDGIQWTGDNSIIESISFEESDDEFSKSKKIITYKDVPDISMEEVRMKRDKLLKESDAYLLTDFPTSVTKTVIKNYRKSLREFPENVDLQGKKEIFEIDFPQNPL